MTKRFVSVDEPALKNVRTPKVVEVAFVVVAFKAVKSRSVVEPVTSRFAEVRKPRFAVMPRALSDPPVIVRPLDVPRPAA